MRLLIVEDEYLIAYDLACALEDAGAKVLGPAPSVVAALELLQSEGGRLDGAVLDVHVGDGPVYPVAEALAACGVPFVLTTGYDQASIPAAYASVPRLEKPVDKSRLIELLKLQTTQRQASSST